MRGVILVLTILMPAITAWARVDIFCTVDGNEVTVNYRVVGEPNKISAFALDITVDSGAKIKSISNLSSDYWVYPGSIVIVNGEVNDVGSPVCDPNSPGALGGLDTNGITIEMGALHDPPGDAYLPSSGTLLKFRVDKASSIHIQENLIRGGVVLTNPSLPVDPNINCSFCFACFPCTYSTYKDWLALNMPDCWCGRLVSSPRTKWPYQCDGDADNTTQGIQKFRVYSNDFNILVANWKKIITDTTLNPCADFDHLPQGLPKYRVYTNDFNILVGNWKKTDAQLPGNCPRGQ
jgi:hypothetical protein